MDQDAQCWRDRCTEAESKLLAIELTLDRIEAEPLRNGEPAESVSLGRWQVCDEIRAAMR